MTRNTTPYEDVEQKILVRWLVSVGLPHFHANNEMWTKSIKQKTRAKEMGVSSGVPDLFVVIPAIGGTYSVVNDIETDETTIFNSRLVAIELKRQKGGVTSKSQKVWLESLANAGIESTVCAGADEAKKWLTERIMERIVEDDGEDF